jgi:hypothetical protein
MDRLKFEKVILGRPIIGFTISRHHKFDKNCEKYQGEKLTVFCTTAVNTQIVVIRIIDIIITGRSGCNSNKCLVKDYLFNDSKCTIAEISGVLNSASILPLAGAGVANCTSSSAVTAIQRTKFIQQLKLFYL